MLLKSVRTGGLVAALVLAGMLPGCRLIYRQTIEQGNLIEQKMVDQLKPGMSKRQVTLIMGSPAVQSPFRLQRWDYMTSVKDGRTGALDVKKLTLFFQGDQLARIEGDFKPDPAAAATDAIDTDGAQDAPDATPAESSDPS